MSTARVTRHVIDLNGRSVHYRRAGSGPPFVLLHESPRSSVALLPLMQRLADRFTVIGVDTPGFGTSDPLPLAAPDAADYAEALEETLAGLGLQRVPVYGTHTGAVIAMELACRHPDRVACVLLDGYPLFDALETENILRQYLPPFVPTLDGAHVGALWARVRDQCTFFPWYLFGDAGRLPIDCPPLVHHGLVVNDYLRAGDQYRIAYAAAFRYDGAAAAARVRTPAVFLAREDDLLYPHLDRLPPAGPGTEAVIDRLGSDREAWAERIASHAAAHPGQTTAPPPPDPLREAAGAETLRRGYVDLGDQQVHVRIRGGPGRPLVMIPPIPGDSGLLEPRLRHALGCALALDLPGTGGSDPAPDDALEDRLLGVLDALGIDQLDVAGEYVGAGIALRLAARAAERAHAVALLDPPPPALCGELDSGYVPDLTPGWDGRHLQAAWYWVRDAQIYEPWYDRRRRQARSVGVEVDVERLHREFVAAVLGAGHHRTLLAASLRGLPVAAPPGTRLWLADRPGRPARSQGAALIGGSPRTEAEWLADRLAADGA